MSKGNKAWCDRLKLAIAQIRQDGSYQKVQSTYFSFDVYGQ